MPNIDRAYVAIALVMLILGEILGLYMGIAANEQYRPIHVALVLPGFAVLCLYGMLFRLWPAMKQGTLAVVQFWINVLSAIGIVIGAYLSTTSGSVPLVAISSAAAIIGAALTLWMFWTRSAA
jgi:hypothetical protein